MVYHVRMNNTPGVAFLGMNNVFNFMPEKGHQNMANLREDDTVR